MGNSRGPLASRRERAANCFVISAKALSTTVLLLKTTDTTLIYSRVVKVTVYGFSKLNSIKLLNQYQQRTCRDRLGFPISRIQKRRSSRIYLLCLRARSALCTIKESIPYSDSLEGSWIRLGKAFLREGSRTLRSNPILLRNLSSRDKSRRSRTRRSSRVLQLSYLIWLG